MDASDYNNLKNILKMNHEIDVKELDIQHINALADRYPNEDYIVRNNYRIQILRGEIGVLQEQIKDIKRFLKTNKKH